MGKVSAAKARVQADYPRGLDFEQVWAALMENREQLRETDRIVKQNAKLQVELQVKLQKETAELQKETDRQMKEFNRRFGDFTNRFGEVVEYMIAPNLQNKFSELGLIFPKASPNSAVSDIQNQIFLEIDVLLENGDKAMLVEVKTKLTTEDIKDHIMRLEKMRAYADVRGDKRIFLGAVAGVVMTPHVKKYALGHGFYVIEPSGETFVITSPSGKPREW